MVMDTLKKDHEEMHQRLVSLQNEKDKVSVLCVCSACTYCVHQILYTYKFSRDVNFTNDSNLAILFSWITCYHTLCFKCITIVL